MASDGFSFADGNLAKLLALPKYVLSLILSWFVPRVADRWVFGSGIGVGEGALAVARELRRRDPESEIVWLVGNEAEFLAAEGEGFTPMMRSSRHGYWATLRAGTIVVTHGLGDANRFGVFGGRIVQLWHGAPLKKLHFDSPVTTEVRGPALLGSILRRMYRAGADQVSLYIAASPVAAGRLRTAFRVAPGKVLALGDPRDDELARQARDPQAAAAARAALIAALGASGSRIDEGSRIVLYAPTWRDGETDPAVPDAAEAELIRTWAERTDAHLIIRSHPLGSGAYESLLGDRVHALAADAVRDVTPLLGGVDLVITDYSSIALDFSLMHRPIVWFAPDLEHYELTRGLYEPLVVTSGGTVCRTWEAAIDRAERLVPGSPAWRAAASASAELAERFHAHPEGGAASRVLDEIRRLHLPLRDLVPEGGVFFESFYGRQISCNPLALDREIAARRPDLARYWSVTSETQRVPDGAIALLVGGRDWLAARSAARLVVVNDWLRYGFRRGRRQIVLQTWHGTMLKHLALGRPNTSLRTRLAIKRESRRWNLMLSQNPHSSAQFRENYAFRGEILETGYPRDDRLARAILPARAEELAVTSRNPVAVAQARRAIGAPEGGRIVAYAPTWRDRGAGLVDELEVSRFAAELGEDWTVVVRGHTRTHEFGEYLAADRIIDASRHDDIDDVILAADVLITDYSSVMFDASVARVPMLFMVPDLERYRDRERGFTFDFEAEAPGPLVRTRAEAVEKLVAFASRGDHAEWLRETLPAYEAWREKFNPWDDGRASERVVDALVARDALS